MKFHSLLPVRDEADIINQYLQSFLTWADSIYVFDTGSVYNTWEIIHAFLLPILDSTRPSFSENTQPQPILEEINKLLIKELSSDKKLKY